jgi:hypothetical protein
VSINATRVLKAGLAYFAWVFGAGFVLGSVRVPWLVPRLGVRMAELIEMPLMLCVIVIAARWTVRRFSLPASRRSLLSVGVLALAFLLLAELALVMGLQGMTLASYLASRDPVSGSVYAAMLLVFAAMPSWVDRGRAA